MPGRARIAVREGRIEVHKTPTTRYRSTLRRADGVVVALEGGSWNRIGGAVGRVPHDLAHLVVERHLGITHGLWGLLAVGGLVQNARFAAGRLPPHALERARQITAAASEELRQTEVLVRATADASLSGQLGDLDQLRRQIGERWWHPGCTPGALVQIDAELRGQARAWDELPADGVYVATWP